jgi:hypothetical protein
LAQVVAGVFFYPARESRTWSMTMKDVFEKYLLARRQDRDDKTELSDRGALEILLNGRGGRCGHPRHS